MRSPTAQILDALKRARAWVGFPALREECADRMVLAGHRPEDVLRLRAEAEMQAPSEPEKRLVEMLKGDAATLDSLIVGLREEAHVSEPMYDFRREQIEGLSQTDRRTTAVIACNGLVRHEGWSRAQAAAQATTDYQLDTPLTEAEIAPREGPSDQAKQAIQNMIRKAKEELAATDA